MAFLLRKNAIVDYLDYQIPVTTSTIRYPHSAKNYQIPVTQPMGPKGNVGYASAVKRD